MSLENARDSYVDLLVIKAEQQAHKQRLRDASKSSTQGAASSSSGKPIKTQTSFRVKNDVGGAENYKNETAQSPSLEVAIDDLYYEPCEVEEDDEDSWPIWEMTNDDPWRDINDVSSIVAAAGRDRKITSIAACERIFTVPEVYDEMQSTSDMSSMVLRNRSRNLKSTDESPCHNLFHCFNPWKQQHQTTQMNKQHQNSQKNAYVESDEEEDEELVLRLNPKGMLRQSSLSVQLYLGLPASKRQSYTPSMFNVHFDNEGRLGERGVRKRKDKSKYKVHFSELKRVLRVRKFNLIEATEVWFQREDFDYFKNEMTLLIQEDEASRELAQVWLEAQGEYRRSGSSSFSEGEGVDGNTRPHRRDDSNSSGSAKWWHDYDHSRRGLERYASPGQARQILASYKIAVKKVLGEQQRQRLLGCLCIPGANDPEKIAQVFHEYTSWSRDLALAAGASDADAVRTNFDENKRHTREYYMLKQVVASGNLVHKHMPQFMMPKCISPKGFLDETKSFYHTVGKREELDTNTRRGSLLGSMVAGGGSSTLSGEEAREEMSHLHSKDLAGPVSPALVPSLQPSVCCRMASKPVNVEGFGSPISNGAVSEVKQKRSMAEKAKNYPFQH